MIAQLNSGFLAYPLADPTLLADITLNGLLQSNDVGSIQQAIVQLAVANIPALPAGLPAPPVAALDPRIFIPQDLAGTAGRVIWGTPLARYVGIIGRR